MKRASLLAVFAAPALIAFVLFGCVGDDPGATESDDDNLDGGGGLDAKSPDQSNDAQSGNDADVNPSGDAGGDAEAGDPPPHVPVQGSYIKASNTGSYDFFGDDVAISADGNTMVVGAGGEGSGATGVNANQADNALDNSGAAYVFVKSGGVWAQQAYLKPSNVKADGNFGSAVAISADGNRIAVGAKGDNSVYVYRRTQSAPFWLQEPSAAIKPSNGSAADGFGYELALSGDGNTLAIGALGEKSNATGVSTGSGGAAVSGYEFAGAVYVWTYSSGNWSQSHYIKPSDTEPGGRFGWSVALNGAGTVLAVGAMGEASPGTGISASASTDTGAASSGAVYIFEKSSTWNQTTFIKAKNSRAGARFGERIAMSGSGTTLVVGADYETSGAKGVNPTNPGDEDVTASNSGAAYVFSKETSGWTQSAYLKASNARSNAYFGRAVSISYDGKYIVVSGTGETSAATGVNNTTPGQDDTSLASAGAAYAFGLANGKWTQTAYLKAARAYAMNFGISNAVANGGTTIAVGGNAEPSNDTGVDGTNVNTSSLASGAVYMFK